MDDSGTMQYNLYIEPGLASMEDPFLRSKCHIESRDRGAER